MEHVILTLGNDEEFERAIVDGLPQHNDLEFITRDFGTQSGAPAAVITFGITLPDGSHHRAQAVTTISALSVALSAIEARYGKNPRSKW